MEPIKLTRDFYDEGYSYPELVRQLAAGELHSLRRGAYTRGQPTPDDSRATHLTLVHATARVLDRPDAVVSHMSAAAMHGLPLWDSELTTVHLTCARDHGGRQRTTNFIHVGPLAEHEVVEVDGVRVTTVARTVVDLSRRLSTFMAVPIGDAALRGGLTRDELADALARCRGWRGVVRARRTVAFFDPRSESVGESGSRVRMAEVGLPTPDLQVKVYDDVGYLVGRTDFGWLDRRTLGEFDGRDKYGKLRRPDQSAEDVVLDEKARENALRDEGFELVRWGWDALRDPTILRRRIMRGFERADGADRAGRQW